MLARWLPNVKTHLGRKALLHLPPYVTTTALGAMESLKGGFQMHEGSKPSCNVTSG